MHPLRQSQGGSIPQFTTRPLELENAPEIPRHVHIERPASIPESSRKLESQEIEEGLHGDAGRGVDPRRM
jgi:hypothetical protein